MAEPATSSSSDDRTEAVDAEPSEHHAGLWALVLGSIGVVYGDIGTSPLYAMREAIDAVRADGLTDREVIGVASLLIWALMVVVTGKYVFLVMRFDNRGEGGDLSLMALIQKALGRNKRIVFALGVIGAALFYGDATITPAISVLSALEGMKLVTSEVTPYIEPLSILILFLLFAVQARGTERVANFFGPITTLWFLTMAVLGLVQVVDHPRVLIALNPLEALWFLLEHGFVAFIVLGAVFLAVTGAEALYTDMGHFGRKPIRIAWVGLVLPALALNYLGQAALVIDNRAALENPFYRLAPDWALLPLVILATIATVIASQAVITGAFSLTRQAIQLGLMPRLEIRHTSAHIAGQIFVPMVNRALLIGVILLILIFRTSSNLASAYGLAVTGAMLVTTSLTFIVIAWVRKKGPLLAGLVVAPFLVVEIAFFSSNLVKLFEGGFVPLMLGSVIALCMVTWVRGTRILMAKSHRESVPLKDLARMLAKSPPHRVPGTAVFLTSDPDVAPVALTHNLKHNKVLHDRNVILTVVTANTPRVPDSERMSIENVSDAFSVMRLRFGFMETPNVPAALNRAREQGMTFDIMSTSFFLGRRSIKPSMHSGMPQWQDKLYIGLANSAANATDFFRIPVGRVVEMGTQILV